MPACRGRVREVEKFFCRPEFREMRPKLDHWYASLECTSACLCVCVSVCAATHRKLRVCMSVNFPLLPNSFGLSLSSVACRQPRSGRVPVQARIHFQLWWNVNPAPIAARSAINAYTAPSATAPVGRGQLHLRLHGPTWSSGRKCRPEICVLSSIWHPE